jgi:hypothetical protein
MPSIQLYPRRFSLLWFPVIMLGSTSLALISSCRTYSKSSQTTAANGVEEDSIKLKEFNHEVDQTTLMSLAARIGCKQASEYILQPTSGSMKQTIEGIYAAKSPYDFMQQEIFNLRKAEQSCVTAGEPAHRSNTDGMRALIQHAMAKNMGITFVMVGGFGSHLTESGALAESRALWTKTFAAELESKHFRIVRQECFPNSFASDEVCAPKLVEKFKELETERGDIEHRYLLWGYSKGGTIILQALGTSPELREKTLAMISAASPFGGGLPIEMILPIVESLAQKRSNLPPAERASLNALLAFGAGPGVDMHDGGMAAKLAALLEEGPFEALQNGLRSMLPGSRKNFLTTVVKNWDFTRTTPDPLTGQKDIPLLHLAAVLDVARLHAIPGATVDSSGHIIPKPNSQDYSQLAEMAMLGAFKKNPLSDTCVALEHAVIPKNVVPKGATSVLMAILNLDHMSIGLSSPGKEAVSRPRTEIVDAIIESATHFAGVN